MDAWGLDLGTTNSAVARWDAAAGQTRLVEMPAICRAPDGEEVLEAPRLVPSAVHLLPGPRWAGRLGPLGRALGKLVPGPAALIGRRALERNRATAHAAFVPAWKAALGFEPGRAIARLGATPVPARGVARAFLRELLAEVRRSTGRTVRELSVAAPVGAFETYRAELKRLLGGLGVRTVRFVDEPLAAALGYGVGLARGALVLVVDSGAGTTHVELVRLSPRAAPHGRAEVLAKRGWQTGGDAVDSWILRDVAAATGGALEERAGDEDERFWRRLMLAEARRVKERLYFDESVPFLLAPPGLLDLGVARPGTSLVPLTRTRLVELLGVHGYYDGLSRGVDEVLSEAGVGPSDVDEVLLVGGSTLLPGVFGLFETRFGRSRLRAWEPFEAVALGTACFASGETATADFVMHDYAIRTWDAATGAEQHTVVVPRGTRFPTAPDLWKRQLVPTCALGEPERVFKLVICELARRDDGSPGLVWDAAGDLVRLGGREGRDEVVVPLNAESPGLGALDPPHRPDDRRPRLEVAFGVDADRWLVATVRDLMTRRELMRGEPVVRLV